MRDQQTLCQPETADTRRKQKAWRFLFAVSLAMALLWIVHPLSAGQRRARISGSQIVMLQKQATSRRQLKAIYLVMLQYAADYEGRLPALGSPALLRKQVRTYRLLPSALLCPFTNKEYLSNKNLAGKKLEALSKPANTLLFWSPQAMPDGHYLVLDASGMERRLTAGEYANIKRSSNIK